MIDVSIILVGTNEHDFVCGCLQSILDSRHSYKIEVIVVDNASTDLTTEAVLKDYSWARLIVNTKKKGYIENNNMAMQQAKGRYILLLNADIELKNHTLQETIAFMDDHPEAGSCGCKLLFDDGTLQLTCRRFPTPFIYFSRIPHFFRWLSWAKKFSLGPFVKKYLMMDYDHAVTREVDWIVSAFWLLRREALDDVGEVGQYLLQPFYLEDVDWCFRARVRGWKTYYVPHVTAIHHYQRSSVKRFNKLSLVHLGNILIFYLKNGLSMILGRHRRPA